MYAIELTQEGIGYLINQSEHERYVLHSDAIQASELILTRNDNETLTAYDVRSNEKIDNTVYQYMFTSLESGTKIELFRLETTCAAENNRVTWGPYRFENVDAGKYRARIRWTSLIDTFIDEETGEVHKMPHVWLGTVESKDVVFDIC